MENGDRILVEHPENVAFQPDTANGEGSPDFYVRTAKLRFYGTFDAVTGIVTMDAGEVLGR
jgi:hypothetical protein